MSREPFGDSQLGRIMLKFRPIAPKPPAVGALITAVSDRAGTAPMMKRRRGGRKPKKITTAVKKETGAVVTVERVMEVGRGAAAASGKEIKRRLEADASPCFVSDSADRVTWINAGFRRMVLCEESSPLSTSGLMRVELVTRGTVPGGACGGFTCVARVRRGKVMMVVPCDVWRVVEEKLGKWAWRLDVATALGLGLSCAY
ncbi:hypothetical protein IEQ34_021138 [Dendrobium chrysotoxum]|uniref:DUF7950 domain-containing protein n=1 Tax=Dendrobium chrysotoxum TaxID=161865 RepID=A0AAV7G2A2_DENCH|nr:hypothetical protein IEQ34_021138 [Dendrobium chrysotoxum]